MKEKFGLFEKKHNRVLFSVALGLLALSLACSSTPSTSNPKTESAEFFGNPCSFQDQWVESIGYVGIMTKTTKQK